MGILGIALSKKAKRRKAQRIKLRNYKKRSRVDRKNERTQSKADKRRTIAKAKAEGTGKWSEANIAKRQETLGNALGSAAALGESVIGAFTGADTGGGDADLADYSDVMDGGADEGPPMALILGGVAAVVVVVVIVVVVSSNGKK